MEIMNLDLPNMKISEEGDEVVVKIWISGFDEKDIELNVEEDSLEINIARDFSKQVKGKNRISQEWRSSSFGAVTSLPCKVTPMLIHHSYDGKILEVRLKKLQTENTKKSQAKTGKKNQIIKVKK